MNKKKLIIMSLIGFIVTFICIVSLIFLVNSNKGKVDVSNLDTTSPIIILDETYVVKKGYDKNLIDVIMSVDDIDNSPKREIIGNYDLNNEGEYNLTYKIEDASGNSTIKDFILKVKNDVSYKEETIKYEEAVARYKKDNTQIGIDVSKWQGEINWEKVKNAGTEFAFLRMAYQKGFDGEVLIDPYFEQNITECKKYNIPVAIYFSSYAKSKEESIKHAEWILQYLEEKGYNNLYIAFDWENWSSFNKLNLSLNDINEIADCFMDKIEENGNKSILYGSKTYLEAVWKNKNNYPVWLANYVRETKYEGNYDIWQFSQKGIIDGIKEPVDLNVMFKRDRVLSEQCPFRTGSLMNIAH